ncbi:2Fe-2S iron-sulfur cluster-binding protein [Roseiterribacter gracilis]
MKERTPGRLSIRLAPIRLRLASGLVLFAYLTAHFLTHALGNISVDAMEKGLVVHEFVWRGVVGSIVLYGAFTAHIALAFWALYARRSFRIGGAELTRLVLGFVTLYLLLHHYIAGRLMWDMYFAGRSYPYILLTDFVWQTSFGVRLAILFVVGWVHGCMGIHFWLRYRPAYKRRAPILLALACALPIAASLGVVHGTQDAIAQAAADPTYIDSVRTEGQADSEDVRDMQNRIERNATIGFFAALLLTLAARAGRELLERRSGLVRLTYPGGQVIRVPRGVSVLDASRRAKIPHVSVCGGRGRCSTCRVRIVRTDADLPEPSTHETQLLARLGVGPDVRLACQLRPDADLSIVPLVSNTNHPIGERGAVERFAAILFVDIRGSTKIVEERPPFDVVFIMNRFCELVCGAVVAAGGTPAQFLGDGVMAIFGESASPKQACRQVLDAAQRIERAMVELNRELSEVLAEPLRIGLGVHAGDAIIGRMGYRDGASVTAVGEAVHIAARLQDETKTYGAYLVASDVVMRTAGFDDSGFQAEEIQVRGRSTVVGIRVVPTAASLSPFAAKS